MWYSLVDTPIGTCGCRCSRHKSFINPNRRWIPTILYIHSLRLCLYVTELGFQPDRARPGTPGLRHRQTRPVVRGRGERDTHSFTQSSHLFQSNGYDQMTWSSAFRPTGPGPALPGSIRQTRPAVQGRGEREPVSFSQIIVLPYL